MGNPRKPKTTPDHPIPIMPPLLNPPFTLSVVLKPSSIHHLLKNSTPQQTIKCYTQSYTQQTTHKSVITLNTHVPTFLLATLFHIWDNLAQRMWRVWTVCVLRRVEECKFGRWMRRACLRRNHATSREFSGSQLEENVCVTWDSREPVTSQY